MLNLASCEWRADEGWIRDWTALGPFLIGRGLFFRRQFPGRAFIESLEVFRYPANIDDILGDLRQALEKCDG